MAAGLRGVVRASKDAAIALALRRLLNHRLGDLGEITALTLDTATRRAALRLMLPGERDPIAVRVRAYDLYQADGRQWLTLVDAEASRDWLTAALQRFAVGRPFVVSPHAARVLRLLA